MTRTIKVLVACLASGAAVIGSAQTMSMAEVLQGKLKSSMPMTELPDDYHAVMLAGSGSSANPMESLMGGGLMSMMMLFGAMGGQGQGGSDQSQAMKMMDMMGLSWTRGDVVSIEGQRYAVTYKLNMDMAALAGGPNAQMSSPELNLHLVRVDSILSISPRPNVKKTDVIAALHAAMHGGNPSGAEEGVVTATAPAQRSSGDNAKTEGLSKVKQLALAAIMYASDYDDVLPLGESTSQVMSVIEPYMKQGKNALASTNPNGGRFLFNMNVTRVNTAVVDSPAEVPLWFDERFWPDGSRIVGFCDGHAKVVSKEDWPKVEAQAKRKWKRKA